MKIYQPTRKLRPCKHNPCFNNYHRWLCGWGGGGRAFIRATDDTLSLGRTTENEIEQRMGSPYEEGVIMSNGKEVKTITYSYANTAGGSVIDRDNTS